MNVSSGENGRQSFLEARERRGLRVKENGPGSVRTYTRNTRCTGWRTRVKWLRFREQRRFLGSW